MCSKVPDEMSCGTVEMGGDVYVYVDGFSHASGADLGLILIDVATADGDGVTAVRATAFMGVKVLVGVWCVTEEASGKVGSMDVDSISCAVMGHG